MNPLAFPSRPPDYDADDDGDEARDARLMPPPPAVGGTGAAPPPPPRRKQLNTPLGAMLPEKYASVEITDLFPDFREDKVCAASVESQGYADGSFESVCKKKNIICYQVFCR